VILTGGDPLMLSPRRIIALATRLRAIAHVKVLRLHTRVPVAEPERVSDELVAALKSFGRATYVALHANHEREFSPAAEAACARLVDAGLPMLSQSVLLRGVNDSPPALEALMRRFVENRIKPYYLHHADLAPGTRRFRTSIAAGQRLVQGLRGHVSGLCQPTYVLDIPGGSGKAPLAPVAVSDQAKDGSRTVLDRHGGCHHYPDILDQSCG
jgi:lysine 2,3-aminomutase